MPWPLLNRISCTLRRFSTSSATASAAVSKNEPVTLRPYQEEALKACTDALARGVSRIGVSLPTGSGKTTVFLSLLSRISPSTTRPEATRALVIVNAVELARQAAAQARRLFPEWTVEIEQGAKYKATGEADLTVATYQTLLQTERLRKFDISKFKAVIIDEAHHAAAPSYRRILSQFHPAVQTDDPLGPPRALDDAIPLIGVSATFSRHDGLALGSVFEEIVYHNDFLAMIKDQWLCDVRFTTVQADIDLSEVTVSSKSGDFNATSLAHVVNTPAVNELILRTWLDKGAGRKSTLIFCINLDHVRNLTQLFRHTGINAQYIYAGTPPLERQALVTNFKAGKYPVLINCAILTEGADIPNIDCVMVARPTRSKNVFTQMIGRGMRLSPETGKKECLVIDFVDSSNRVAGVVSTPTLFGLDPSELVDGESLQELEERTEFEPRVTGFGPTGSETSNVPSATSVNYTDYDDPFSFFDKGSGAPHLSKLSTYSWVGCGGDIYILELMGQGYLRISPAPPPPADNDGDKTDDGKEKEHPIYVAHYVAAMDRSTAKGMKVSPFMRPRHVLDANSLETALKGCDVYARTKVIRGPQALGLLRTARWRDAPASDSQKLLIRKRWKISDTDPLPGQLDLKADKRQKVATMTKGEAANILTRLTHGAQKRYDQRKKQEKKVATQDAKEVRRKAKEHVQVGPLTSSL